jgi:PAS domain S-box-containing protein
MFTNVLYMVVIFLAGGLTTVMAVYLWINRRIIEATFTLTLIVCLWLWIAAQIGECLAVTVNLKIIFYKIKYINISLVSVFMLGFSIEQVRGKTRWTGRLLAVIAVPILVCQCLSFFPVLEPLVWRRFFVSPNNLLLEIDAGPGYTAYNIYDIGLLIAAYGVLLAGALSPKGMKRRQLLPFLAVGLLASGAALADFLLKREIFYYRTMPIALAVSSLSVIYYLRLRYFRTIPLAQHAVSQSMSDGLIILNPHDEIMYVNPSALTLFRASSTALIGRPLTELVGELAEFVPDSDPGAIRTRTITLDGKAFDVSLSPIRNRRGRVVSKVFVLRDVTHLVRIEESLREMTNELERKVAERTKQLEQSNRALQAEVDERTRAEERLRGSLEEKSVLLGELHHRVKNNLQVVSSLLRLQSHYLSDPAAQEMFAVAVSRIRSMAMVHERLYRSEDLAHTQFGQYLHELVHSVIFSHSKSSEIFRVDLQTEPIELDIDTSILTGLIVNELVMNSLKHAFPDAQDSVAPESEGGKNVIALSFKTDGDDYVLDYTDNGPGLPPDFDVDKTDSLGLKIVVTLVKQLKGTIEFLPRRGMHVHIRFPVRRG